MKKILITVAIFPALLAGMADHSMAGQMEYSNRPASPILSTELSGRDLEFFDGAGPRETLLIRLSGLAAKHAVTPEVKAEAETVFKEQTAAAAQLKTLASAAHISLNTEPDSNGQKALEALRGLESLKFDKSYLDAEQDAQDWLEISLKDGAASSDKRIKELADSALNTLKGERVRSRKLGL